MLANTSATMPRRTCWWRGALRGRMARRLHASPNQRQRRQERARPCARMIDGLTAIHTGARRAARRRRRPRKPPTACDRGVLHGGGATTCDASHDGAGQGRGRRVRRGRSAGPPCRTLRPARRSRAPLRGRRAGHQPLVAEPARRCLVERYQRYKNETSARWILRISTARRPADGRPRRPPPTSRCGWTRYKHLLLDEFQDTNPAQWRILQGWLAGYQGLGEKPARLPGGRSWEQSIYRFVAPTPAMSARRALILQADSGATVAADQLHRGVTVRRCSTGSTPCSTMRAPRAAIRLYETQTTALRAARRAGLAAAAGRGGG